MGKKLKNLLKTALKFLVSGIALYVVSRNINWEETRSLFGSVNTWLLVPATAFFVASKVISAIRLNRYFQEIELNITGGYNLRLYWIGMFYNLFLPGGIGGDGYKVYLLNKKYGTKVKPLVQATLLDRLSGLVALVMLAGIGYGLLKPENLPSWLLATDLVGLLCSLPLFYLIIRKFFVQHVGSFWYTNLLSLVVQMLQVVSAYFILLSLGLEDSYLAYQVIFLVSSVVAVFPFTIGGVGARELTFILGSQYLLINENVAVAFSFLFFLITALSSLVGGFLKS